MIVQSDFIWKFFSRGEYMHGENKVILKDGKNKVYDLKMGSLSCRLYKEEWENSKSAI
jgi:hypothetical protein